MKKWLFLFICMLSIRTFAQQKQVEGIVFDKDSKDRIAKVNIVNATTGKSFYNNLKGEFTIDAQPGDMLIFIKADHYSDTLKVQSSNAMAVYMKRSAIMLREVYIRDTLLTPEKQFAATKRDFTKIYGSEYSQSLLSVAPGLGAGIGIDALYNAFSRSGRNAAKLRATIEEDYHQREIDFRFNRAFVASVTRLKDQQLTDFMQRYRPGYFLVKTATDYEFITSIKTNLRRFMRSPRKSSYTLAPLITPAVTNN
ncbi:peptidase associated/transthyretin-like domain-containing protein [Mucilaginibacter ginsenosidivorax]|uniref:Carboxypeptidase-like regulatory domain-containing protein n=1 Tax=Mucilaginibacter ginsenosidivorax TaxID=862126 RepID=A0A5B8W2T2_9SPHI|nr:carboxypeptidase-like regulatory domain-containing protein [Mucilaginibacter ginsenosidivorax]QEC76628.1 carboxypeptidase-like regulatory domain-containing protein [Mucilaginibacter ginsenosidivorax]